VFHPDVRTFDVTDRRNGSVIGVFYLDTYARTGKRSGAWHSAYRVRTRLLDEHVVLNSNNNNFTKAAAGEPVLISLDDARTLFHEFGHAIHYLTVDVRYPTFAGSQRDFVEYPSQVNELWASYPEVLANYAKHHKTGQPIPRAMIDKLQAAAKFDQGYQLGEVVEAALLDMKWHALTPAQAAAINSPAAVNAFENQALAELGLAVELVPPRYRTSYFRHIFSSPAGYSAGYYSYLWTEMLDRDSRQWFLDNGGLTRANGDHYRATVLSRGGTQDYFDMYRTFSGREPNVRAMLEARGLTGGADDGGSGGTQ